MQTECPHRRFCRLDEIRDELSPQATGRLDNLALFDQLRREGATEATALKSIGCSRATPGQMVQIDRTGAAIEAGFSVKESEAVCPVSKLCCVRACSRCRPKALSIAAASSAPTRPVATSSTSSTMGELSVGALNAELAKFERFYNDYRPHQALGQAAPMQAYNQNFNQSALAA